MGLKCGRNGVANGSCAARLSIAVLDVGNNCRFDLAGRRGVAKVVQKEHCGEDGRGWIGFLLAA